MSRREKPKTTMEFKSLTPSIRLPVLGLGTWEMGGEQEADTTHDRENILAIRAAIEQCRLCGYGIHGLEMIQKRAKTLNLANLERSSPFDYGEHTLFFR